MLTQEQKDRLTADYARIIADDIIVNGFNSIRSNIASLMQDAFMLSAENEKKHKEKLDRAMKHVIEVHGDLLKKLGPE